MYVSVSPFPFAFLLLFRLYSMPPQCQLAIHHLLGQFHLLLVVWYVRVYHAPGHSTQASPLFMTTAAALPRASNPRLMRATLTSADDLHCWPCVRVSVRPCVLTSFLRLDLGNLTPTPQTNLTTSTTRTSQPARPSPAQTKNRHTIQKWQPPHHLHSPHSNTWTGLFPTRVR